MPLAVSTFPDSASYSYCTVSTSKLIGRRLALSPRTVDVYRARLMRKYAAATTPELVKRLLGG